MKCSFILQHFRVINPRQSFLLTIVSPLLSCHWIRKQIKPNVDFISLWFEWREHKNRELKPTLICENGYFHGGKLCDCESCLDFSNEIAINIILTWFVQRNRSMCNTNDLICKAFYHSRRPTHAIKSISVLFSSLAEKYDCSRTLNSRLLSGCLRLCWRFFSSHSLLAKGKDENVIIIKH